MTVAARDAAGGGAEARKLTEDVVPGVDTRNKFAFLNEDEEGDVADPQDLFRLAEKYQQKEAAEAKAAAEKKKKAAEEEAKKKAAAKIKTSTEKPSRPEGGERGGRGAARGGARGGRGGGRGAAVEGGGPERRRSQEHQDQSDTLAARFEGGGRGGGGRGGRGGFDRGGGRGAFRGRGGGGQNGHRPEKTDTEDNNQPDSENNGEARSTGRGGRGGFARGGRGGAPPGRGRQLDRHSGSGLTGVKSVDKKDGHGRGNWGDQKDELSGETEPLPTEGEEAPSPPPPKEKTEEEKAREAEEQKLASQKTLSEFKAELEQKKDQPKFNTRKVTENDPAFPKLTKIKKDKFEDEVQQETIIVRREPKTKALPIDIQFTDRARPAPRLDRPPRGARGGGSSRGGSGGTGRGRPVQEQDNSAPDAAAPDGSFIKLDDFPSLG